MSAASRLFRAPRALNAPVTCSDSSFSQTAGWEALSWPAPIRITGVRRTRAPKRTSATATSARVTAGSGPDSCAAPVSVAMSGHRLHLDLCPERKSASLYYSC